MFSYDELELQLIVKIQNQQRNELKLHKKIGTLVEMPYSNEVLILKILSNNFTINLSTLFQSKT